jgi:single-strand DNA-binding protein
MTTLSNSVHLIGRLGVDPKKYEFENGNIKAVFSLATNEYYKNAKGEKVEQTHWHNIVAFGKVAKVATDYLAKGKEIALEGKLTNRSYEDKDGNKKYITEVLANQILILDKKEQ